MTALVRQLVPEGVEVVEGPVLAGEIRLSDAEMAFIGDADPARRLQFLTGRLYARKALASMGIHEYPLVCGPRREPLWPSGIVGSISHSATWCAVVVASVTQVAGLGVDIEDLPVSTTSTGPQSGIASLTELDVLRGEGAEDPVTLAFSAKDSVYKARRPSRALEYADVVIGNGNEGLVAQVNADAPPSLFRVRWATGGSRLATVATPV